MRYLSVVFAMLTLVVIGQLVSFSTTDPVGVEAGLGVLQAQENPIPVSEESITAGRIVYVRFCSSCHGSEGKGDGAGGFGDVPPANLVDEEWDHGDSDAEIFATIRGGVPPDYNMEPWEGRITDEAIWNTVNYIRDLASRQ